MQAGADGAETEQRRPVDSLVAPQVGPSRQAPVAAGRGAPKGSPSWQNLGGRRGP